MKTAEEILEESLSYMNCEGIIGENTRLERVVLYAMEEYRSQLWTSPCNCNPDDKTGETLCCNLCGKPTARTESKELPSRDVFISELIKIAKLEQTREGNKATLLFEDMADVLISIASPLLALKDARIRELEEELEREKNSVRIITKDVVDQILNPSLEIGKTYKTKGGSKGTVIAWIAQIKMYQVKYWNDEIHEVNSKGEAVLLDNINATPYDLILTPPKN